MSTTEPARCCIGDCPNTAKKGDMCWGHYKRRQRKKGMSVPLEERRRKNSAYETPLARLLEAAFALTELGATDDVGWKRGRDRLDKAAMGLARARGWRPPAESATRLPSEEKTAH
jgi:hypothetical protein